MRKLTSFLLALSLAVVLLLSPVALPFETATAASDTYAESEVLVEFYNIELTDTQIKALSILGFSVGENLTSSLGKHIAQVQVPTGLDAATACLILREFTFIKSAEVNRISKVGDSVPAVVLDDELLEYAWYMESIDIYDAWDVALTLTTSTVRVAVIDTGAMITHPDLVASLNTELSRDLTGSLNVVLTEDQNGHGTHVSGIIAATSDNLVGSAGVASVPGRSVVDLVVISVTHGRYIDNSDIIEALNYAVANDCQVINMSLTGYIVDPLLEAAVEAAVAAGITVVCAAGNNDVTDAAFPSDYEGVISVIATDMSNARADFSNYGAAKDICAPGVNIVSTYIDDYGYVMLDGTSMACPIVTGVVALLLSVNPTLTTADVKEILYNTAKDIGAEGFDDETGHGLVNAYDAINYAVYSRSIAITSENDTVNYSATLQMSTSILPSYTLNKSVVWSVTDGTGSATIDENGLLTPVYPGTVTVRATAADGSGAYGEKVITIVNIAVSSPSDKLRMGSTMQMSSSDMPLVSESNSVVWSVINDTGEATIDDYGVLTGVSAGTVTVRAEAANGSGVCDEKVITILQTGTKDGFAYYVDGGEATIYGIGGEADYGVIPSYDGDIAITSIGADSFAEGDFGKLLIPATILDIAPGAIPTSVVIYGDANSAAEAYATANGNTFIEFVPINSIAVSADSTEVIRKQTLQMSVVLTPSEAFYDKAVWSVINGTGEATIDNNGVLTGVSAGDVTVRATSTDGTEAFGELTITVNPILLNEITLNAKTVMANGRTIDVSASSFPEDADNLSVVWSIVEGESLASIDTDGVLTASGVGTVKVRATAADGGGCYGETVIDIVDVLQGDINTDSRRSALDLSMLCRYLAQIDDLTDLEMLAADINGDGRVSALDLSMLCRHLAKIELLPEPPVPEETETAMNITE